MEFNIFSLQLQYDFRQENKLTPLAYIVVADLYNKMEEGEKQVAFKTYNDLTTPQNMTKIAKKLADIGAVKLEEEAGEKGWGRSGRDIIINKRSGFWKKVKEHLSELNPEPVA